MSTVWPVGAPWSYSALDAFETCPFNYASTRVWKTVTDIPSQAQNAGQDMHKSIQDYIDRAKELPLGLTKFKGIIQRASAEAIDVQSELSVGLTSELQPCGFFDASVSCRMKIDYLALHRDGAIVLDWKSSSAPRESDDQLYLYCLWVLARYSQPEKAHAGFVYSKYPTRQLQLKRENALAAAKAFAPRVEAFQHAHTTNQFPVRPCFKCEKFCPVKTCPHNGKRQPR